MTDNETLGERLRGLREQRGLTLRALADKVGVDFTYLSKIENDRLEHSPSVKTLVALAEALGIDELELMDLANKVPSAISAVARSPEALRFFRRASQEIDDPAGWQELTDVLDQRSTRRRQA